MSLRKPSGLLLALLPNLLFSLIYLGSNWVPAHDTFFHLFSGFHYLRHLLTSGELPFWSPYIDFGRPAHLYLLNSLHPSLSALLPLAMGLGIQDVKTLFFISLLINEVIFVFGLYLLGTRLYQSRAAVLFVCFSLGGTLLWYRQIYYSFHIFYSLPLVFWLIIRGLDTQKHALIAAGFFLLSVTGLVGLPPYNLIVTGSLAALLIPLWIWSGQAKLKWVWEPGWLFYLLPAFCTSLILSYFLKSGLSLSSPGRDAAGRVSLDTFLTWAMPPAAEAYKGALWGEGAYPDFGLYAGLLALPFALLGLARLKRAQGPWFFFFGLLLLFSAGAQSFLAPIIYYLPPFYIFRHLGHLLPLARIFLLLIAGFGFDRFVMSLKHPNNRLLRGERLYLLVLPALYSLGAMILHWPGQSEMRLHHTLSLVLLVAGVLLLALARRRSAVWLLLLLVVVDVNSYRADRYLDKSGLLQPEGQGSFLATPLPFVPFRVSDPFLNQGFAEFAKKRAVFTQEQYQMCLKTGQSGCLRDTHPVHGVLYRGTEQWLGADVCTSLFRTDLAPPLIERLRRTWGLEEGYFDPLQRPAIQAALGCNQPKLHLFGPPGALEAENSAVALAQPGEPFFAEPADLVDAGLQPGSVTQFPLEGQIEVTHFSPNQVGIQVVTYQPAWLYYADTWDPNWQATLNQKSVPILRVNLAFKAIALPAGISQIALTYRPPYLATLFWMIAGLSFTLVWATLFGVGWVIFRERQDA